MLTLRIERHGTKFSKDVLDDCQHADFFFSNGYIASCYHNDECMVTEYYQNPIDPKIFNEDDGTLWQMASDNKVTHCEWQEKQKIDEEVITDILDYYAKDELVKIEETYYE